jgi:hypothetical protein
MWGATLVICITIVLTSLATATAASLINGKNIKKGTITGNKLKKDTVTGTQIKESSLKKVPSAVNADTATIAGSAGNATTVGGVPASAFAKGAAQVYSANAQPPINTVNSSLLKLPGVGELLIDCDILGDASARFKNEAGKPLTVIGSATASSNTAAHQDPSTLGLADGATVPLLTDSRASSTFQVWNNGDAAKSTTVTFSQAGCGFTATAVVTG